MIEKLNTGNANDELECLEAMEDKINEIVVVVNALLNAHPSIDHKQLTENSND